MKNNYQIISNARHLQLFVNHIMVAPKQNETYYLCLFARSKYAKDSGLTHISSDKQQLKRDTCTPTNIKAKLRQMECVEGAYEQKGTIVPQEALGVYINPNPRDMVGATKKALSKFVDLICNDNKGYNPVHEILSQIQTTPSRKIYLDFDFDIPKDQIEATVALIDEAINQSATTIIETRGGFHLLVELNAVDPTLQKTWHRKLSAIAGCDMRGDNMLPIPGCYQGGFSPKFLRLKGFNLINP